MKRILLFVSTFSAVAALAQACGGTGDDLGLDASNDQTSGGDVANDVTSQDVVANDTGGGDATPDVVQGDVTIDSPADAPPDVISVGDGGGNCTTNANCLITEYCERGAGKCSGKGVCTLRPQFCNNIVSPVCGCDKQTYSNECYAHKAGETVAYTGSCE